MHLGSQLLILIGFVVFFLFIPFIKDPESEPVIQKPKKRKTRKVYRAPDIPKEPVTKISKAKAPPESKALNSEVAKPKRGKKKSLKPKPNRQRRNREIPKDKYDDDMLVDLIKKEIEH